MINILIADDHAIVRRGLRQILSDEKDIQVEEAEGACDVLRLARSRGWDAIVLDLDLPGKSGMEVLKELRQEYPRLPVLILSMHPEDQFAIRTLKAGAAGYMTKASAPDELVSALRRIVRGGKYISEAVAEKLLFDLDKGADRPPHERLSDREFQVMRLIASGRTVSEIADELNLSVPTISTYRTRIMEKMTMRTNAELTHYAIQRGLVS